MGHFYTIIGYEVVPATGNFFYSHAYTMYYGEPFTHTGALAEFAVNDQWTVYGGWVNGWDQAFNNPNDRPNSQRAGFDKVMMMFSQTFLLMAEPPSGFSGR